MGTYRSCLRPASFLSAFHKVSFHWVHPVVPISSVEIRTAWWSGRVHLQKNRLPRLFGSLIPKKRWVLEFFLESFDTCSEWTRRCAWIYLKLENYGVKGRLEFDDRIRRRRWESESSYTPCSNCACGEAPRYGADEAKRRPSRHASEFYPLIIEGLVALGQGIARLTLHVRPFDRERGALILHQRQSLAGGVAHCDLFTA